MTLWAPAKPPGEAEPLTSGGQHFMFEAGAEKANQPAADRCNIEVAVPQVQAQLALIGWQPGLIKVEHARQQAAAIIYELVQVSGVCAAGGITSKMTLEIEHAQLQVAI